MCPHVMENRITIHVTAWFLNVKTAVVSAVKNLVAQTIYLTGQNALNAVTQERVLYKNINTEYTV